MRRLAAIGAGLYRTVVKEKSPIRGEPDEAVQTHGARQAECLVRGPWEGICSRILKQGGCRCKATWKPLSIKEHDMSDRNRVGGVRWVYARQILDKVTRKKLFPKGKRNFRVLAVYDDRLKGWVLR
jgi:hypothetical protein